MKQPASLSLLERLVAEPPTPSGGQKGAAGLVWAAERVDSRLSASGLKKQLPAGAACRLCSGTPPERFAWLESHDRVLLAPARCADLPPAAKEAGQHCSARA